MRRNQPVAERFVEQTRTLVSPVDLHEMHRVWDLRIDPGPSNRRRVGPLITRSRQVARGLLRATIDRQSAYNASNTRVVAVLVEALREQHKVVEDLRRRDAALERRDGRAGP